MNLSNVLDTAIGLFFVFALTAGLASVVTELIARFTGLRAAYLLQGLRELVGEDGSVRLKKAGDAYREWLRLASIRTQAADVAKGGAPTNASPEDVRERQRAAAQQAADQVQPDLTAFRPPAQDQERDRSAAVTSALLGTPIVRGTGMRGTVTDRGLTMAARSGSNPSGADASRRPRFVPENGSGWAVAKWFGSVRQLRSLPSYVSPGTFSEGVLQLLACDQGTAGDPIENLRKTAEQLPEGDFRDTVMTMLRHAGNDVHAFRSSLESWYDDHMNRVSGWYKRRTAWITVVIGAVLVTLLNVNAIAITKSLYLDSDLRNAVVAVAVQNGECPQPGTANLEGCLTQFRDKIEAAQQQGLPIGWGDDTRSRAFSSLGSALLTLLGFLLTVVALVPGARFWFDAIGKAGSLRSTGPKP